MKNLKYLTLLCVQRPLGRGEVYCVQESLISIINKSYLFLYERRLDTLCWSPNMLSREGGGRGGKDIIL